MGSLTDSGSEEEAELDRGTDVVWPGYGSGLWADPALGKVVFTEAKGGLDSG